MDDFRLKVFIAAARTLSFTRAAEQLYISQPAVSKHIGELEARYRTSLFVRRGSRLALTDAGRTMLAAAERLAEDYRRLEYEARRMHCRGCCPRRPQGSGPVRQIPPSGCRAGCGTGEP